MNSKRYDIILRNNRYADTTYTSPSFSISGLPNTVDNSLVSSAPFTYVTQIRPYNHAISANRGWFEWTFRDKYNWYSSSYFPVSPEFKLHPRYLYPKYKVLDPGIPYAYDAGAWVGWKDDLPAGTNTLTWLDSIQEPKPVVTYLNQVLNGATANKYAGTRQGGGIFGLNDNIFNMGTPRMPIAIGPRLDESTDIMCNLTLVNSRRKNPVGNIS
jgi:hypothetical protein